MTNTMKGENPHLAAPLMYDRDRHIITFGPNGSGKTRRLLVPNLYGLKDWSLVVIDPKGELCRMTAAHRAAQGANVIILNPYDLFGMTSTGFNPIKALDPDSDDFADDAFALADAIIKIDSDAREPHWAQSAQDIVTALIMYARLKKIHIDDDTGEIIEADNLAFVRSRIGQKVDDFKKTISDMVKIARAEGCEELEIKAGRWYDIGGENKELQGIISTAVTQTRWLDSKAIKRDLGVDNKIDFEVLKQRPTTIYLILPAQRLATQSPWLRLMIASMMQRLMKDAAKPKVPTLLMFDEFAQLGHLSIIENNIALMRGYGVKLWGIFQDLTQAQAIYPKRWESFIGNAGVLNGFAPQDVTTAGHFSSMSGTTTIPMVSANTSNSLTGTEALTTTYSHSVRDRTVLLPQEVRGMDDGFLLNFTHLMEPSIATFAPFYTNLTGMEEIERLDPSL